MPFLLIAIRKQRWDEAATQFRAAADISADCLFNLHIRDNELSAWLVDDEKSNLNRILVALAATKDHPSHVDCITFDYGLPAQFNIKVRKTKGGTPDADANRLWHHDLIELSARQVAEFAVEIQRSGTTFRLREKLVGPLIRAGVNRKELDQTKINPKLALALFGPHRRWQAIQARVRRRLFLFCEYLRRG